MFSYPHILCRIYHAAGVQAGKIKTVLDDSYRQMILAGLRYWNGSAMTAEPAANAAGGVGAADR